MHPIKEVSEWISGASRSPRESSGGCPQAPPAMKRLFTTFAPPVALAMLIALPGVSLAQEPVKHQKETVTIKATIEAIDHDMRMVTLKEKDGKTRTIYAGSEVRRFDELKGRPGGDLPHL